MSLKMNDGGTFTDYSQQRKLTRLPHVKGWSFITRFCGALYDGIVVVALAFNAMSSRRDPVRQANGNHWFSSRDLPKQTTAPRVWRLNLNRSAHPTIYFCFFSSPRGAPAGG